jgi:hypothetical protein
MTSIVKELSVWTVKNAQKLRDNGVEVRANIPDPGSNVPWKASIGMTYASIIVSYTVWERTILQTELLVLNSITKKTIVMEDRTPSRAEAVHADLDDVVTRLMDNAFG